ncbi:uncharacterized protein LOC115988713 [Quercus lobata]|uniref:uncharacterized protein LOC115988713 n=1 Tax=Quercus lobata TaxID=97700 RepID=UPI0012463C3F|nr:uncharacterized protein LOC115988713 [Quercus lobata]
MQRCNKLKFLMISHLVQRSLKRLALWVSIQLILRICKILMASAHKILKLVHQYCINKDQGTSQEKQAQFFKQKNKGVQSNPVPSGNEESRGSAFLIQNYIKAVMFVCVSSLKPMS